MFNNSVFYSTVQYIAVYCNALWYSALKGIALHYNTVQCGAVTCSTVSETVVGIVRNQLLEQFLAENNS